MRMIKNGLVVAWWAGLVLLGIACEREETPPGYAGIVEYDERLVAFDAGGRLVERRVERGSRVEEGELLGRLDDSLEVARRAVQQHEAEAARAQSGLVKAGPKKSDLWSVGSRIAAARAREKRIETNLERERTLHERDVTPQAVVDELERTLEQARAERQSLQAEYASLASGAREEEVSAAEARALAAERAIALQEERISRYRLTAPLTGQILEVHAAPGETMAPGSPLVTLADVHHPVIEVFVPQQDMDQVALGQKAELRVDAYDRAFLGQVEYISPKTEFTPRFIFSEEERPRLVIRVRVRIDDPNKDLHSGLPGFVRLF